MAYEIEVRELLYKVDQIEEYRLTIPILKKAIYIANENKDILLEMECRLELMTSYLELGDPMKAIVNFSWCITQMKNGYINDELLYEIMWSYKSVVINIVDFVAVPLKKIDEIFEDMKTLYIENNASLKAYYSLKFVLAMDGVNDGISVQEYYRKWLLEPKDEYVECTACALDTNVSYYIFLGEYERALKEAQNIINGRYKCTEVPHVTFASLILPVYSLGKYELAETLQKKGLRLIDGDIAYVESIHHYIMYLSLNEIEKAIKVFERNYPNYLKINVEYTKMWFNEGAFVLFSKLEEKGVKNIKLKLPKESQIYSEQGCEVSTLKEFFEKETIKYRDAFDKRNGNNVISKVLKKELDICGVKLTC